MPSPTSTTPEDKRVALDHIAGTIAQHRALTDLLSDMKERSDALGEQIKAALGENIVGTVDGVDTVTLPFRENTSLDRKAVQAILDADTFASVLRHTQYRPLRHVGRPDATSK